MHCLSVHRICCLQLTMFTVNHCKCSTVAHNHNVILWLIVQLECPPVWDHDIINAVMTRFVRKFSPSLCPDSAVSLSCPRPDGLPPSSSDLGHGPSRRGLLYSFCHHHCGEETLTSEGNNRGDTQHLSNSTWPEYENRLGWLCTHF